MDFSVLNNCPRFPNVVVSDYMVEEPNQHHRELLSTLGLDFSCAYNSSSRKQMFSSQIQQWLPIKGATERRIQTGVEREFGKYTFSVKMPCDGVIVKSVDRYPVNGISGHNMNPETIIIYENVETREIDYLRLTNYFSLHSYFGFNYKMNPKNCAKIRPDAGIKEGTIFADSPSVTEDGGYKYGIELNLAHMSLPGVDEDGLIISKDVLPRLGFTMYTKRVFEFGSKLIPLNLYSKNGKYCPFPDIGDYVNPDNIVAGFREYKSEMGLLGMSAKALTIPDIRYDKLVYGAGGFTNEYHVTPQDPNRFGRVIDIKVWHDHRSTKTNLPPEITEWLNKYTVSTKAFYQKIYNEYNSLVKQRGENLKISPRFCRFMEDVIEFSTNANNGTIREFKKNPLDEYRIEITIAYDVLPSKGFKYTDTVGCKGVLCEVWEPEQMPVNAIGRRADIIMAPRARPNRMNFGGSYEQFFNAIADDFVYFCKQALAIRTDEDITPALNSQPDLAKHLAKKLSKFLYTISPVMVDRLVQVNADMVSELEYALRNGIYIYSPPENEKELTQAVIELCRDFPQVYGPVRYIDDDGNVITTTENVRIGSVYIMALEKIGNDWLATNSGKLQHFGILTPVPKHMKYLTPTPQQPVKGISESESRLRVSYDRHPIVTADILDQNNSPITHEVICQNILNAENATGIDKIIDRSAVPLGTHKGLQILKHILLCRGIKLVYKPYRHKD